MKAQSYAAERYSVGNPFLLVFTSLRIEFMALFLGQICPVQNGENFASAGCKRNLGLRTTSELVKLVRCCCCYSSSGTGKEVAAVDFHGRKMARDILKLCLNLLSFDLFPYSFSVQTEQ